MIKIFRWNQLGCAICLVFYLLYFFIFVAAANDTRNSEPKIIGPVPCFKEQTIVKRLHEQVYIDVRYPEFGITFIDEDIKIRISAAQFEENCKTLTIEKYEDNNIINSEQSLSYDLYSPKKDILSVVFSSWFYFSGPHGYWSMEAATYDLVKQNKLQLRDIFPNWKKAQKELPKLAVAFLEEDAKACMDNTVTFSKEDTNFYLEPEGMTFVYSGMPMDLRAACSAIFIDKKDLQQIEANLRYWNNE